MIKKLGNATKHDRVIKQLIRQLVQATGEIVLTQKRWKSRLDFYKNWQNLTTHTLINLPEQSTTIVGNPKEFEERTAIATYALT